MKKIVMLILITGFLSSCDKINYVEPIPVKGGTKLYTFPAKYQGVYVESSKRNDTLFVGNKDFYFKNKPSEKGKASSLDQKSKIGNELVLKTYQDKLFVSLKKSKSSAYWNARYIKQQSNKLYIYKLSESINVKDKIYDYSFDNKSKKYTIKPSKAELDDLILNGGFLLDMVFVKLNSKSYKPKLVTNSSAKRKVGCLSGNCNNGYGVYQYTNGDSYFGFFKNSKRHGYGQYKWDSENDLYTGNWENGNRKGFGKHYWGKSKTLYVGEWKNHIISGYGYRINSDYTYSRGLWQNGRLISTYQNNFNGKYDTSKNGCVKGDCSNKFGKYVWDDGNSYEGFYINGKRLLGTFKHTNGDKYEGQFNTSGSRDGTGFYTYANGNTYEGQWLNGKKHGLGVFEYKSGKKFYENWDNGKQVSTKLTEY